MLIDTHAPDSVMLQELRDFGDRRLVPLPMPHPDAIDDDVAELVVGHTQTPIVLAVSGISRGHVALATVRGQNVALSHAGEDVLAVQVAAGPINKFGHEFLAKLVG